MTSLEPRSSHGVVGSSSSVLRASILSRKISLRSFARHFAKWMVRDFVLEKSTATLAIGSPQSLPMLISLDSHTVHIGRHDYAGDGYFWLWIKYFDRQANCPKEIVMKFEKRDEMILWETEITRVLINQGSQIKNKSTHLMCALADFLCEQTSVQLQWWHERWIVQRGILLESSQQESTGFYYQDNNSELGDSRMLGKDSLLGSAILDDDNDHDNDPLPFIVEPESLRVGKREEPSLSTNNGSLQPTAVSPHTMRVLSAIRSFEATTVKVPSLNILIMAVGTRGDIQPFLELGLVLQSHGHFVRLATHENFRSFVSSHGLDFYPLAGDPVALSEFMVKTQGFIIPTSSETIRETPKYHGMMVDILYSCWDACLLADPHNSASRPFAPDAIISNPVTYAHIHCAEALGVPLHLMFPQPWIPTKAFPHPLSCLSYTQGWCSENYFSYQVVDRLLWLSMESEINNFRAHKLGLEPIRAGQSGWNILNYHQVPFVKMWSPGLVPKPKDWPSHVDVVGTFFPSASAAPLSVGAEPRPSYQPAPELASFLAKKHSPVVYVGFGSMVLPDLEGVLSLFLQAAALLNVRIIVQIGWSSISTDRFLSLAQKAQQQASIIGETEEMNSLEESLIFPRSNPLRSLDSSAATNLVSPLETSGIRNSGSSGGNNGAAIAEPVRQEESRLSFSGWLVGAAKSIGAKLTSSQLQSHQERVSAEPVVRSTSDGWDWSEVDASEARPDSPENASPSSSHRHENGLSWNAADDAYFMGPCPHEWLFQQVDAVVHHGGAGTTAMGLRYACPTWICPFFGDQFFWGQRIHSAGLGPKPCPVQQLTLELAQQSLDKLLFDPTVREACRGMSQVIQKEDGVGMAVQAFYRHLPLQNMICDISLLMHRTNARGEREVDLAHVFCNECGLKMSLSAYRWIHRDSSLHMQDHTCRPCVFADYSMRVARNAADGLVLGVGGLVHEMIGGITDAATDPLIGLYSHGLQGGIAGMMSGIRSLVSRPVIGSSVLLVRLQEGLRSYHEYLRSINKLPPPPELEALQNATLDYPDMMSRSVLQANQDSNNLYTNVQQGRQDKRSKPIRHSAAVSALTNHLRRQRIEQHERAQEPQDEDSTLEGPLSPGCLISNLPDGMITKAIGGKGGAFIRFVEPRKQEERDEEDEMHRYGDESPLGPRLVQSRQFHGFAERRSEMRLMDLSDSQVLTYGTSSGMQQTFDRMSKEDNSPIWYQDGFEAEDHVSSLMDGRMRDEEEDDETPPFALLSDGHASQATVSSLLPPTLPEASTQSLGLVSPHWMSTMLPSHPLSLQSSSQIEPRTIRSPLSIRDAFAQAEQIMALFHRLIGKKRRFMSEARFVHLLLRVIAREQVQQQQLFCSDDDHDAEEEVPLNENEHQMAAILALFLRLTQPPCAQLSPFARQEPATVHSMVQSQGRVLDFVDFVLFLQSVQP